MPQQIIRAANLVLALLAAGCAPSGPRAPVPSALPRVGAAETPALAELLRLEDRREYDEERLRALLLHPHPVLRARAAVAVGRIGDPAGGVMLRAALLDSIAQVRADAAFALGLMSDTSAATVQALAGLLRASALPGGGVGAGIEAAGALGKLGGGSVVARDALVRAVAGSCCGVDRDSAWMLPAPVVREALLAVWRLPRSEGAVDAALARLRDDDPETRWRAAYALMRMGAPRTVTALVDVLEGAEEHRAREFAARGLRAAVSDSAALRPRALTALRTALRVPHPHVRINAVRALGTYRDAALVGDIAPLLRADDTNIAIAAAQTLAELGASAAGPLDAAFSDAAAPLALRGAALASLTRVAPERGAARAAALAASDSWLARLYAARALGSAPWMQAGSVLEALAADRDPRVAAAAIGAAAGIVADTAAGARALFVQGLAAADPGVRAAAIGAIGRDPVPADLPVLLDAYARASADTLLNDAALAAVDALGRLAERGVPVDRSFFLRFQAPADPVVRARVAARLGVGSWGPPRPIATARDSAFYLGVARELLVPALQGAPAPRVRILTPHGPIDVELLAADAPLTVRSFMDLAARGYFDGQRWHRVVPNFVLQGGDPRGDGSGGPGYAIRDEINRTRYLRGVVGMALSGPDTGGSQFFITHSPQPHLDGGYTIFGKVVDGMQAADRVVQDDPITRMEVLP